MSELPILVGAAWLAAHPDAVRADVRWYLDGRSGRVAFEAGHLPGAVFVDLDTDLTEHGPATAGRHPLASPARFAATMGALGIGDEDTVVAYDDSGGGTAGRLVWMLRTLGRRAALLDGGLGAWAGERETGPGTLRAAATFTAAPWPPDRLATADDVAAAATDRERIVLDARAPERYRGEIEPVDPRAGHVPGARNAPWAAVVDPATGRFRSPAELRRHFEAFGVRAGGDTVVYCGSGVSACADYVALEHAGLGSPLLFVASWSGWSSDPGRPVATGDE
jgi:thiosulfate/3-mercaptopyruvate sulfurtransferase